MTAVRVTVEWGFGKVYNMGQLITQMHTMKLQETPVNYHVKSDVLLCNAHFRRTLQCETLFAVNLPVAPNGDRLRHQTQIDQTRMELDRSDEGRHKHR
jgi:hypothetical protein